MILTSTFKKQTICPVCGAHFEQTHLKSNHIKIVKKDTDFCNFYEGEIPYVYNIIVCKTCGYSASDREFNNIKSADSLIIREHVMTKWKEQDFTGERSIEDGIVTFKLAMYQASILGKKKSYTGLIALKIAWLYRFVGNKNEENKFMKMALNQLKEAFMNEKLESDTMSVAQYTYLIGELHRKLGMPQEAIKWFASAIEEIKTPNPVLTKMIKEQRYVASEEYKEQKLAS